PDFELKVGSASHAVQTARVMERIETVFVDEAVDVVVVPGDVNSTLAAALVASKLGIAIVHLEAGLRSGDRTMPEELNRILVDQLSDLLLTHSPEALGNLEAEGVSADKVRMVGNTMIDALVAVRARFADLTPAAEFGLSSGEYLLVTLHRPALVDGPLLFEAMQALSEVAASIPVVFPVHPRTMSRLSEFESAEGLHLCKPLGYLDFLAAQAQARAVLTDSGGVQEETTFLGVPCFTLRDNTERPVTIDRGSNTLLGLDPQAISTIPSLLSAGGDAAGVPDLWDGHSAERVADALIESGLLESIVGDPA
ncbi:MAG: UDP-N-acetylglucosamine 2-epimerase (non-hydrolyzing), partial [Solirubrobacterales bacterium]|nr:UDP-N-acetylglucosamine 2-epimerase (non-hydrolyzing) [Solirubrobacterales bacterium]